MHDLCIVEATSLINNLSDIILWKIIGLPVGDWMLERITVVFDMVVTHCFPTEPIVNGTGNSRL